MPKDDWEIDLLHPKGDYERQRVREILAERFPQPPPQYLPWPLALLKVLGFMAGFTILYVGSILVVCAIPLLFFGIPLF